MGNNYSKKNSSKAEVIKNIWVGDIGSCNDKKFFKTYKINTVINLSPFKISSNVTEDMKRHDFSMVVGCADFDNYEQIKNIIDDAVAVMIHHSTDGILIYCDTGVNWSPAVICKFLMIMRLLTFDQASALVKNANNKRGIGCLNSPVMLRILMDNKNYPNL